MIIYVVVSNMHQTPPQAPVMKEELKVLPSNPWRLHVGYNINSLREDYGNYGEQEATITYNTTTQIIIVVVVVIVVVIVIIMAYFILEITSEALTKGMLRNGHFRHSLDVSHTSYFVIHKQSIIIWR